MNDPLSVSEVKNLIKRAEESFRHQECATCECYLGYLTQIELDADPEGGQFLKDYQPERDLVHACLGCDPCPPGILYTNYLRKEETDNLAKK